MYRSFLDWDLKDAGLVTSLEPVPLCSKGDHSGEFDRRCKTKHTQREGLYVLRRSELGVEESVMGSSLLLRSENLVTCFNSEVFILPNVISDSRGQNFSDNKRESINSDAIIVNFVM